VSAGRAGPGERLRERARRVWRWFFPPAVPLPEGARQVLRTLYPALDLGAVSFHAGMPHLLGLAGNVAITLPALLAPRRTRVYVEPRHWDPESVEGLGTLAHEAYHALQAQEAGWGLGPFRPFLVLYLACAAANRFRYPGHPMEEDAYRLAGCRQSLFESTFAAAGDGAMEQGCAELAAASSELRFWRKLAASTPLVRRFVHPQTRRLWPLALLGFPLVALWLLLWGLAVSLVWLARLLVETGGAAAAGLLWGGGLLLSFIERIFTPSRAGG
jgi:hypothetical protein